MPRTYAGDSATYYRIQGAAVGSISTVGFLLNLPGGQVKVNDVVVTVRELESGAQSTTVQTNGNGYFPDVWVPLTDPDNDVITVDWPDDGIEAQPAQLHTNEDRQLMLSIATTAGAAAAGSAAEAATAARAAQLAAERAAADSGGTSLPPDAEAKLARLSPNSPAPFPGMVLVYDETLEAFIPGAVPAPVVSAGNISSGTLSIERLAPGSMIVIDYFQAVYGAAGAWPSSRPTARTDIVIDWRGPEPGPGNLQSGGDRFSLVLGQP